MFFSLEIFCKTGFASSKKVPFLSATFPEEENNDPDFNPFLDEPHSPYLLTQLVLIEIVSK